jgi:hypothetical protein
VQKCRLSWSNEEARGRGIAVPKDFLSNTKVSLQNPGDRREHRHIDTDGFTLKLPNFGKFKVRHTRGKMRKIPLTGKVQMTADKRKVKFIALSNFRGLEIRAV